jgi:hypothetical protein
VRDNLYVDAGDPREAGFGRFINDHGPEGTSKPNVIFHTSKDEVLIQTLREVLRGSPEKNSLNLFIMAKIFIGAKESANAPLRALS